MKKIVLIPSYEPDEKLIDLLKNIDRKYDVIVVNDGSSDKYNELFKIASKYCYVLSYKDNMGKGYALKEGFKYIKNNYSNYIVVTMDSDGQHRVKDADKLIDYAEKNIDTLVLGKRTWDKSTPLRSRIGNGITRRVFKKVSGNSIYDTQTGLRAFSYKLMDYMLNTIGNRYEYEMNVLLNLGNIKFKEIDIETIYFDNNKKSHFNTIKDSYKIYKNIIKWKK